MSARLTHDAVREILRTCGPLSSADVASFFPGVRHRDVASVISRLRGACVKAAHVCDWEPESDADNPRWRAVYAFGDGPDVPKPRARSNAELCRRWRRRASSKAVVPNSVWQLGAVA